MGVRDVGPGGEASPSRTRLKEEDDRRAPPISESGGGKRGKIKRAANGAEKRGRKNISIQHNKYKILFPYNFA